MLIIQTFIFDGKEPKADIRLKGSDLWGSCCGAPGDCEAIRGSPCDRSSPSPIGPDDVDSIAVYCEETSEVYAIAKFQ